MGKSTRTNTAYRRPADRERREEKHQNTHRFFKNLQNHGDSVIFFEKQANFYYREHYRKLLGFKSDGLKPTYITEFEIKRPYFNAGASLNQCITYSGEHIDTHLKNLRLRIKFSQYFIDFYELMFSFKKQLFELNGDEGQQLIDASFNCDVALYRGYERLYPNSWLDIGLSSQTSLKEPKTRQVIIKTIDLAQLGKNICIAD